MPLSPDWLIYFEDATMPPEIFTDEGAARQRFSDVGDHWNCHLFKLVESR